MKKRYIIGIIGIISIFLISLPIFVTADEVYGNIICTEKWIPVHKFECRMPDMSIDKVFQTKDQMTTWYEPLRSETFIPTKIYVWTVSNLGI